MSRLVLSRGGSLTFAGGGLPGFGGVTTSPAGFSSIGTSRATGTSRFSTVTVRPLRAIRT